MQIILELLFWPLRLSLGSGGGDGGAGARSAVAKAERDSAIGKINQYFGIPNTAPTVTQVPVSTTPLPPASQPTGGYTLAKNPSPMGGGGNPSPVPQYVSTPAPSADPIAAANKATREAMYADINKNVQDLGQRDLDKQTLENKRAINFYLGRSGLTGGSVDVDKNQLLQDDIATAATRVANSGLSAENQFRTSDEAARTNAINAILGGADTGTAIQGATNQLSLNARDAASRDYGGAVGNAFSSLGDILGARANVNAANQAAALYGAGGVNPLLLNNSPSQAQPRPYSGRIS